MLTASIADPRREGAPAPWNRFVADERLPATWSAAAVGALAWLGRSPSYLGVVCDRSGAPCAIFHLRHLGAGSRRHAFCIGGRPTAAGLLECRLGPTSTGSGHRFAAGLDAAERRAALSALERAARASFRRSATAIAYRDVSPADVTAFGGRSRLCRHVAPEVVVENRWADTEAFYAELPPKRRSELRRLDARLVRDEQLVIGDERALEPASASRLAASVARRHGRVRRAATPIPAAYFDALAEGTGVEFLTYRDGAGRLLSFATLLDDGTDLADAVWGNLDPLDGGRPDLYFHHYLRAVAHLIARRRRRIALGKGLGPIKLRYGGRYEERFVVGVVL